MSAKPIYVEFIDSNTGQVFGAYDAPPDTLPSDFSIDTTLHIGDIDWKVVKAEPPTRTEYVQSGKLRLTLAKIMHVPVKNILYTLPTIFDAIPSESNNARASKNVFEMHEDDWRQIEFVAAIHQPAIISELEAIAAIYDNHRIAQGFNKLHIRTTPKTPLVGEFSRRDIEGLFAGAVAYDGTAYQRKPTLMNGTFALRYGKIILYGAEKADSMTTLGLSFQRDGDSLPLEPIVKLMKTYRLYLVDWCRVIANTHNDVEQYLRKMGL